MKDKMKILVLGSNGMLGTDLMKELEKTSYEAIGFDRVQIDITSKKDFGKIDEINPDIVINCAAYTRVDKAEEEKEECYNINSNGARNVATYCREKGIALVHISTDYVFDGDKEGYYENDKKNPINYYGKTKAEAENAIIKILEKYYIVRTSWLFGKSGKNFVDTISKLSKKEKEIKVVNDQIGSPTYTVDLTKGIIGIINRKERYGIYHLTNSGTCSWFDFAKEIVKIKEYKCAIIPIESENKSGKAKRPHFSTLKNTKVPKLRNWKKALKEYLDND